MMGYTDRHFRMLMRFISPHFTLYTPMITAGAIVYGNAHPYLKHDAREAPLALQLGGSDPQLLAQAVRIAQACNFSAINLNVGCPSSRVQQGGIGACLMLKPQLVAECVQAMQSVSMVPVTIKTRIGVDHQDSYAAFTNFIDQVAAVGCNEFTVHARKAWLKGLNPKQNRNVPELNYAWVYQLKKERPHLRVEINGGIHALADVQQHLQFVDGVMLGRWAINQPYALATLNSIWNLEAPSFSEVLKNYLAYATQEFEAGERLVPLLKPLLNMSKGQVGARLFRRHLSDLMQHADGSLSDLKNTLSEISFLPKA